MDENEKAERLKQIAKRFYKPTPPTLMGMFSAPFDTNKPNLHDCKGDFVEERDAVDRALEYAKWLLDFLASRWPEEESSSRVPERVCAYIDAQTQRRLRNEPIGLVTALIRSNAAQVGVSTMAIYLLLDLHIELANRKQELADQEVEFWSGSSRPPNHYARTIALRFARLIAKETGRRPTVGTSKDGDHPSTDFGRAIEEIFEVLEIKANFRRAAQWAVSQLTEEDINPPLNSLAQMMSPDFAPKPAQDKTRAIVEALMSKGQGQ